MKFEQLITPNPDISCTPGMCLEYTRKTFSLKAKYYSATDNWNASNTKHKDKNFPANCDIPVWFSLRYNPNGHVALLMRDGTVYSSSHPTSTTPVHHASLSALISYYAKANPLTYLGWTEDIENISVIKGVTEMTPEFVKLAYENVRGSLYGKPDAGAIDWHVKNNTPEGLMRQLNENKEVYWKHLEKERDAVSAQNVALKEQLDLSRAALKPGGGSPINPVDEKLIASNKELVEKLNVIYK